MTQTRTPDPREDRYVERTKAMSTVYGAVGPLTSDEDAEVRRMYQSDRPSREAAVAVLKMRGTWPKEPDPRKTFAPYQGASGLPRHDGFGRNGRRRRR